jgi:hypothetical protein
LIFNSAESIRVCPLNILRLSDIIFFWNRDRGSRWQVYSKGALSVFV